jgi:mRNA interferase RelE/StbE
VYTVNIKSSASKSIRKIPQRKARIRVEDAIEALAKEPRPEQSKQLEGKYSKYRRIAVGGEYRIVYQVRDKELLVLVVIVAQREGVYEILRRLG